MLIDFDGNEIDIRPGKIVAVARNYAGHAREMGKPLPSEPTFFLKPATALVSGGGAILLPAASKRVDHEVELCVVIKDRCRMVTPEEAMRHVLGYTIMIDVTARDIQEEAKKSGMPWTVSKGFDTFAPTGPKIVPSNEIDPEKLGIWLKVNGETRQSGSTSDMVFSVERLISAISQVMTLEPFDLIATGTPAGVGEICDGDVVEAGIDGIGVLKMTARRLR
ncbi:MAG: acylpyruvase [Thermoplasmata archaeon HGW-Thermoplasmata-1]|nr:MAG: acylpyruvase [Thermoplasmata archaeon HGW-Thermoplasmata-1]